MSDQTVPGGASDDVLDALASAYLDGAATDAEQARVEADPELQARVAQFRAVSRQLAEPVTVPGPSREAHLVAALAAFGTPEAALVAAAPVTELAAARAKRSRIWTPLAAAAAVGVLLVGVGVAALQGDDSGTPTAANEAADVDNTPLAKTGVEPAPPSPQDQFSVSATTAAAAITAATARTESAAGSASDDAITMAAAAPLLAPVEVGSGEELSSVVDHALDADASTSSDRNLDQGTCSTEGELLMEVVWQGIDAVLYVVPSIADPQQAVVLDLATCSQLVSIPLP